MQTPHENHRPLMVESRISVKTYDIDYANIVHNMVYIRWLEDLRLQLLDEYLPLEKMLDVGVSPILIKTEINYQWPIRFGDRPLGRMWVSDLGRTRWTVQAEIIVQDRTCASATQLGYFADLKTMRPVRVPDQLHHLWQKAEMRSEHR